MKPKMSFEHYWICSECATARGGSFPEGHVCTVLVNAKCEYCGQIKKHTIPYVDFDWPNKDFSGARD